MRKERRKLCFLRSRMSFLMLPISLCSWHIVPLQRVLRYRYCLEGEKKKQEEKGTRVCQSLVCIKTCSVRTAPRSTCRWLQASEPSWTDVNGSSCCSHVLVGRRKIAVMLFWWKIFAKERELELHAESGYEPGWCRVTGINSGFLHFWPFLPIIIAKWSC